MPRKRELSPCRMECRRSSHIRKQQNRTQQNYHHIVEWPLPQQIYEWTESESKTQYRASLSQNKQTQHAEAERYPEAICCLKDMALSQQHSRWYRAESGLQQQVIRRRRFADSARVPQYDPRT